MLIGDFARLGQVSVRMLRHYDAIGLLRPDHVDRWSSYRSYSPEQLTVLNRIVALKDLGLSLDQVGRILADRVDAEQLRGMLRLRRSELEDERRAVGTRLAAVESRLRMIEKENDMPDHVVKPVPALRLAALTDSLDPAELGQHIGPMFDRVAARLNQVHASLATPIATYAETEAGMDVVVGYAYPGSPLPGLETVELPAAATAVCGVHLGPMTTISESWMALHRWLVDHDYDYAGPCRELYVRAESDDQLDWVTELQQPVRPR